MRRAIDFLAPLGFLLAAGAWAWRQSGSSLPGGLGPYLALGATLIVVHLLLRLEDISRSIGRRQLKYGSNMVVLTVVFAVILGVGNKLVNDNNKRWDLTKNRRFSLSDQSRKVIDALQEDVTIIYFQNKIELGPARERMKTYESASERIKVEYVAWRVDPQRAREHDVTSVPTLIVKHGERREKIGNDSEQDIANALIKVTRETKKTVCFVEGEGERDLEDSGESGFSAAAAALDASQYETRKVFLLRAGQVPEDCTVLVLAGPQKDPLEAVLKAVREHVEQGGRLLLMIEPNLGGETFARLAALLQEWNLVAGDDIVLDISAESQWVGTGPLTPLAVRYPFHDITKDFRLFTAFETARSLEPGEEPREGITVQSLVQTSEASWAETDLSSEGLRSARFDPGQDRQGPISLGSVATVQGPDPEPSPEPEGAPDETDAARAEEPDVRPEGRVVAFGDSDFASNAFLESPGNKDLLLNSVAWLAEDSELISIRPRDPDDQRMFMTGEQQLLVATYALLVLPGLFVFLGVRNWWRRR